MKVTPIAAPLPGEHVVAVHPVMRPDTDLDWRCRLKFWSGRALTAEALDQEQEYRAGLLAWRGRLVTSGIVAGLDVALESRPELTLKAKAGSLSGYFAHVMPGQGIATTGEDVVIPRPVRLDLDRMPVIYARTAASAYLVPPPAERARTGAWFHELSLGGDLVRWHLLNKRYTPWAAVLVLRPVELQYNAGRETDTPCMIDESQEAFDDPRRVDAAQFLLVLIPPVLQARPLLKGFKDSATWRNRVATLIADLEVERTARLETLRREIPGRDPEWSTAVLQGELFPWEFFGVPLALVGFEPQPAHPELPPRLFLDRAAVARPGGRARPRLRPAVTLSTEARLDPPGTGTPAVWQSRVAQLNEHLSDLQRDEAFRILPTTPVAEAQSRMRALAARFDFLPPAGLLPRAALHFLTTKQALDLAQPDRADTSWFFPGGYSVRAVPVTSEEVEALLASSAPLGRYDLARSEPVCVLVPLPQRVFDPDLLVVEQPDPAFLAELDRLFALRQGWRQRRDHAWYRRRAMQCFITGFASVRQWTPAPALEPEPWEPFNASGNGYAIVPPTTRAPWTVTAQLTSPVPVGEAHALSVRLHLDEETPPSRVCIVWQTVAGDVVDNWETPPLAIITRRDTDNSPEGATLWRRYERTVATLGLAAGSQLKGVQITFVGGRAAVGAIESVRADSTRSILWTPLRGARLSPRGIWGTWPLVNGPHIVAPFDPAYTPVLPDGTPFNTALLHFAHTTGRGPAREGLNTILADLQRSADVADDAVSLAFEKTRTKIHSLRQVLLGQEAADSLLASPTVGSATAFKPALVKTADLSSRFSKKVSATAQEIPDEPPGANNNAAPRMMAASSAPAEKGGQIFKLNAELPLRTLTIPRVFDAGLTIDAYNEAHEHLRDALSIVARLDLGYDDSLSVPDTTVGGKALTFGRLAALLTPVAAGSREEDRILDTIEISESRIVRSITAPEAVSDKPAQILAKGIRRTDLTVLMLRQVETYIARRRLLLAQGRQLLQAVAQQEAAAEANATVLEGKLAEARHDMAVARTLWQEELQRVDTINNRRDDLLATQVTQLAYVRPRCIDLVRRDLPSVECDRSDELAPVPAALLADRQPPPELEYYLQLFRHAPVRWLRALAPRLPEINTRERLTNLLTASQSNASRMLAAPAPVFAPGTGASLSTYQAGFAIVERLGRNRVALPLMKLGSAWEECRRVATEHATLGDLIDGTHGIAPLARAAAQEIEAIAKVATALHAEFASVLPGIRMLWVERCSQFDRPAPLRDITTLPRSESLTRAARLRLQAYIDWLFGRINTSDAAATSLVNDLIRICLLLASHAPVNQLILGHVPRPIPIRTGILIPLRPIDPRLVHVGMEFQVWRGTQVVARGLVEDLRDGEVSARVQEHDAATPSLDVNMKVQFQPAVTGAAFRTLGLASV
jgi:hypothetical protein